LVWMASPARRSISSRVGGRRGGVAWGMAKKR
jgi:hypothetical protein